MTPQTTGTNGAETAAEVKPASRTLGGTREEKLAMLKGGKTIIQGKVTYDEGEDVVYVGFPLSAIVDNLASSASGKTTGFTLAFQGEVVTDGVALNIGNKGAWVTTARA